MKIEEIAKTNGRLIKNQIKDIFPGVIDMFGVDDTNTLKMIILKGRFVSTERADLEFKSNLLDSLICPVDVDMSTGLDSGDYLPPVVSLFKIIDSMDEKCRPGIIGEYFEAIDRFLERFGIQVDYVHQLLSPLDPLTLWNAYISYLPKGDESVRTYTALQNLILSFYVYEKSIIPFKLIPIEFSPADEISSGSGFAASSAESAATSVAIPEMATYSAPASAVPVYESSENDLEMFAQHLRAIPYDVTGENQYLKLLYFVVLKNPDPHLEKFIEQLKKEEGLVASPEQFTLYKNFIKLFFSNLSGNPYKDGHVKDEGYKIIRALKEYSRTPERVSKENFCKVFLKSMNYFGISFDLKIYNERYFLSLTHLIFIYFDNQFISEIISKKVDLDIKDSYGATPAFYAARFGKVEVLDRLYRLDGDLLNARDNKEKTVAHYTAEFGQVEVLEKLYELNPGLLSARNNKGETPAHYAAKFGKIEVFDKIYRLNPVLLNAQNNDGETPAHYAARFGKVEVLKKIYELNPELLNTKDNYGANHAHYAAEFGQVEVLEKIYESNPEILNAKDNYGESPAHYAARCGKVEVLEKLYELNPEFLNTQDYYGEAPVHHAARCGKVEVLEKLYELNPEILNTRDNCGESPAHYAARFGKVEVFDKLYELNSELLNDQDNYGESPAHYALRFGKVEVFDKLYELNTGLLNAGNNDGETPAHYAAKFGEVEVFDKLYRLNPELLNDKNNDGETPAHYAAEFGKIEVLDKLYRLNPELLHTRDDEGKTVADYAKLTGNKEVEEFLIRLGLYPIPDSSAAASTEAAEEVQEPATKKRLVVPHSEVVGSSSSAEAEEGEGAMNPLSERKGGSQGRC